MWPKCDRGRPRGAGAGRRPLLEVVRRNAYIRGTLTSHARCCAAKVREFVGSGVDQVLTLRCHHDYIPGHTARRPLSRCDCAPSKLLTDER
jgi:hypothetical protein